MSVPTPAPGPRRASAQASAQASATGKPQSVLRSFAEPQCIPSTATSVQNGTGFVLTTAAAMLRSDSVAVFGVAGCRAVASDAECRRLRATWVRGGRALRRVARLLRRPAGGAHADIDRASPIVGEPAFAAA